MRVLIVQTRINESTFFFISSSKLLSNIHCTEFEKTLAWIFYEWCAMKWLYVHVYLLHEIWLSHCVLVIRLSNEIVIIFRDYSWGELLIFVYGSDMFDRYALQIWISLVVCGYENDRCHLVIIWCVCCHNISWIFIQGISIQFFNQ